MNFLDSYNSLSGDDSLELVPHPKKVRLEKRIRSWALSETFDNEDEAIIFIQNMGNFVSDSMNTTKSGVKKYFRCGLVKRRERQCDAALYLLYPEGSHGYVELWKTKSPHNHGDLIGRKTFVVTEEDKSELLRLKIELKMNRKQLWDQYGQNVFETMVQCDNFVQRLMKKELGPATANYKDLHVWCTENSAIPSDDHTAFVLAHQTDAAKSVFRVVLTTKALLRTTAKSNRLHVDATYKLNSQNFPLLVIGTTDAQRKFYLTALAICSGEAEEDFQFAFDAIKTYYEEMDILYRFG